MRFNNQLVNHLPNEDFTSCYYIPLIPSVCSWHKERLDYIFSYRIMRMRWFITKKITIQKTPNSFIY